MEIRLGPIVFRRKEQRLSSLLILYIFVTFFYSFFASFINRLPNADTLIYVITIGVTTITVLKYLNKIRATGFLLVTLLLLLNLIYILGFTFSDPDGVILRLMILYIPMIFSGMIIDLRDYRNTMYYISVIYILFLLVYMTTVYAGSTGVYHANIDYLGFSYYALPALPILIYQYQNRKNKLILIPIALGFVYLLICGTRGPILCALSFIFIAAFLDLKNHSMKRAIMFAVAIVLLIILFLNIKQIAISLYPIFVKNNFSTRILLYFMSDNSLLDSSGRDTIFPILTKNIQEHFLFGTGLMSDRKLLGGIYCHNLFLELLNTYGGILGSFLSIGFVALIVAAFIRTKSLTYRYYIAVFFSSCFVKLMLSSTFISEPSLFIFIGICIAALRAEPDEEHLGR